MPAIDAIDYRWVREENPVRFISVVHEHGLKHASGWRDRAFPGIPQTHVAEKTGISRPTVSALVSRSQGLLGPGTETGVLLDASRIGMAIGVDFSYGHNRVALADVHAQVFQPEKPGDYEVSVDEDTSADWSLSWAAERICRLLEEAEVELADVKTIGVALAGSVDQATQKLVPDNRPMNIGWQHLSPVEELPDRLGLAIPVHLDNDTNASATAEHLWGAARDAANILYVKLNRSCNSALIIRHHLYRGANGFAGEIGHALVEPYGGDARAELHKVFSVAALRDRFQIDEPVSALVGRAKEDHEIRSALLHGARVLGTVLIPIIDLANPEKVVIGGKLGYECYPLVASELGDAIRQHDSPAIRAIQGNVVRGQIPGGTALRGAIALALQRTMPRLLVSQVQSEPSVKAKKKKGGKR